MRKYLEKLTFKKEDKKYQLQTVISQKLVRIQSQNWKFLKVDAIFFKTALLFARSTHVSTQQEAPPPTTLGTGARGSQRSKS